MSDPVPRAVWATLSVVFAVLALVLLVTTTSTALAIVCLVVCVLTAIASSRGVLSGRG